MFTFVISKRNFNSFMRMRIFLFGAGSYENALFILQTLEANF
jgi:hypothetical protein